MLLALLGWYFQEAILLKDIEIASDLRTQEMPVNIDKSLAHHDAPDDEYIYTPN